MIINDSISSKEIYLITGYTDLRKSIDGLAYLIQLKFDINPLNTNKAFIFCGRSPSKIKVLLFEDDGFIMLYKRLDNGKFKWPRNNVEAKRLSNDQLLWLLQGLSIEQETIGKSKTKYIV